MPESITQHLTPSSPRGPSNSSSVVSLDVFDTCVARTYHEPADLLLDLALRTVYRHGLEDPDTQAIQLWHQRVQCEKTARKLSSQDDINIEAIYAELGHTTLFPIDLTQMLKLELELELASCQPLAATLRLYEDICRRGDRVIFVSDMYLPRDTIIAILRNCGYDAHRDNTYVSSDSGHTKASGKLFRQVLEAEQISAGELTHYGDNPLGDYRTPREHGIEAVLLAPLQPETRYQRILLGRDSAGGRISHKLQQLSRFYRQHYRRPLQGLPVDIQLSHSRVAAIARLNAATATTAEDRPTRQIGSYIAAPLFNAFAFWLIEQARERGIRDLYFCARNGQIFQSICELICSHRNLDIRCHYLYGSRAAWYPASLKALDQSSIEIIVHNCEGMTARQIFKALSMPEELSTDLEAHLSQHFEGLATQTRREFTTAVLEHLAASPLHSKVQRHFLEQRQLVLDYFRQLGIAGQPQIGIVDIGWYLSTHNSFLRILDGACDTSITGFFFGVTKKHQPSLSPFQAFISDERDRRLSWMFKSGAMAIFEEIFSAADHATTVGYRHTGETVVPVLGSPGGDKRSSACLQIQRDIMAFTRTALSCGEGFSPQQARDMSLKQFERFYTYPTAVEAACIADTRVDSLADHSAAGQRALCGPVKLPGLLSMVSGALFNRKKLSPNWTWAQGSLAMSSAPISAAGRALATMESLLSRLNRSY